MGIQYDRSELHLVPWFVDGLVRLDEHRVTLMDVFQSRGVEEFYSTRTSCCQVVIAWANVTDLMVKYY